MNTAVAIDTLATMRKLEKAGFKTEQAEAVAEVMANQSGELATKADLETLEKSLRQEVAGLRWTFGLVAGFVVALNLTMFGFLFAVWRDVSSLVAG